MHKAHKELKRTLPLTDAVIEILDARAPQASANPMLGEMTAKLPVLKILNKADLADSQANDNWLHYLNKQDSSVCILAHADKQHLKQEVIKALQQLTAATPGNDAGKRKVVVIGAPNVGKSTVINALAGRKVTKTGNEPAVTRGQQQVKLGQDWMLLDTPGMLWPNLEDQRAALCLALIGSIRQTALDIEDVGWSAAELLYEIDPTSLRQRYAIQDAPENTEALMTAIAGKVGAIGKAGSINWHSTAESLLNDYRSGKLAAISLETPPG